jgi:hypothetical protein
MEKVWAEWGPPSRKDGSEEKEEQQKCSVMVKCEAGCRRSRGTVWTEGLQKGEERKELESEKQVVQKTRRSGEMEQVEHLKQVCVGTECKPLAIRPASGREWCCAGRTVHGDVIDLVMEILMVLRLVFRHLLVNLKQEVDLNYGTEHIGSKSEVNRGRDDDPAMYAMHGRRKPGCGIERIRSAEIYRSVYQPSPSNCLSRRIVKKV